MELFNCSRFSFAQGHYYHKLFRNLPELNSITARGHNAFPIHLFRNCTALKTLCLDVRSINAHPGSAWAPVSSEDALVVLHTLEISLDQEDQWILLFNWLLGSNIQHQSFLGIRGLKRLALRNVDFRYVESLREPLQSVVDLAKETLSSFSIDELTRKLFSRLLSTRDMYITDWKSASR